MYFVYIVLGDRINSAPLILYPSYTSAERQLNKKASTPRLYNGNEKVRHGRVYIYKPFGEKEKSIIGREEMICLFVKKHKLPDDLGVNDAQTKNLWESSSFSSDKVLHHDLFGLAPK